MLGVLWLQRSSPGPAPMASLTVEVPADAGQVADVALSPDARWLVFTGRDEGVTRLWLRPLDEPGARLLPETDGAQYPFWSPDSRSVGFFVGTQMMRIDVDGGSPVRICNVDQARGGTWSEAGVILYGSRVGPIWRVAASGGTPRPASSVGQTEGLFTHRWPIFLPGGKNFLFHAGQSGGLRERTRLYAGALDSEQLTIVLDPSPGSVVYSQGRLLSVEDDTLVARRMDLDSLWLSGGPQGGRTAAGLVGATSQALVSAARSGALTFRSGPAPELRQLVWYSRSGERLGTLGEPDAGSLWASLRTARDRLVAQSSFPVRSGVFPDPALRIGSRRPAAMRRTLSGRRGATPLRSKRCLPWT